LGRFCDQHFGLLVFKDKPLEFSIRHRLGGAQCLLGNFVPFGFVDSLVHQTDLEMSSDLLASARALPSG